MAQAQTPVFTSGSQHTQAIPGERLKRLPELDALRGLMLVWMTLTHLPTHASYYSNQPLGFVSSAEGFIFLSAFLTGRIFGQKLEESGPKEVTRRLWGRAGKLYAYHLFLLGIAFTALATVAVHTKQPSLQGLLDFYLAHPIRAVISSVLLIYRPPLLDILPMYILFLLCTPLALFVGCRRGWKFVLIPSFCIWLGAQFGLRIAAYNFTGHLTGFRIPLSAMGAFDLFGWQMLWALGLAIGSGAIKIPERLVQSRTLALLAAMVTILFIGVRHSFLWDNLNTGAWIPFTDKWRLGCLRLVNFATLGGLFGFAQPWAAKWIAIPPLVTLGKASLEVFCAHLLICFEALALVGDGAALPVAPQLALIASALLALYIVARAFTRQKAG